MDKETFRELCLAHALGALSGADAERFQRALAEADEERLAMFAEAVALAQNLSLAAPSAEPAASVKARLLARVRGEDTAFSAAAADAAADAGAGARVPSQAGASGPVASGIPAAGPGPAAPPRVWKQDRSRDPDGFLARLARRLGVTGFGSGLAFASAALGVGVLVYAFNLKGSLGRQEAQLADSRLRISALEDTLTRKEALLEVLLSHNLQVAVLSGEGPSPTGYGKMIWCPKRRCGILHVANLPAVPEGRDYQLWLLRDGSPVSSGVFQVSKTTWDGDLFRIQGMAEVAHDKVKGFIVTLEPKGGAAAPSGETYLKGSTLM